MMDGVSWTTTRAQESFSRSKTAAETLSRLASFIARADTKPHAPNTRQQPAHLPTYVCPECGKGFAYVADLLHHQELKHTLPKPHRCPSCGQEFSLRSSLQLHKCNHDSSPCDRCGGKSQLGSPCPACTPRTSEPVRIKDKSPHRQPHHLDASPYACALCGRGFSQKQALLHHQQAGCSQSPSTSDTASNLPEDSPKVSGGDSTPGPSGKTVTVCRLKLFRMDAGLQRHKPQTEGQKTKAEGTGGEARKGSNTKENRDIKMPKSKTKLLDCRSCDMVFRSTSKLYLHRKEKHSREKTVRRETRAVMLPRRRRKPSSYPCPLCGKVFLHHLSFKAHHRQHTASSLIPNTGEPVGSSTKDSELSESGPNPGEASTAENKPAKAGPGRPRKTARVEVTQPDREVPEEKEQEEEEEEVEEEEDVEVEFPCTSCAEVFSEQSQLREHTELHLSAVRRRHCSVCMDEMDTCKWPGSKRHRLYHCVPCQQGFSALDSFLEHCQEHLRVRVEEDSITEDYAHQAKA